MGLKVEEYFSKLHKTEEEIKKEWRKEAEKRVKTHLILSEIAKSENITAPENRLKEETDRLLKKYSDADPGQAKAYIAGVLLNEQVFLFLENQH